MKTKFWVIFLFSTILLTGCKSKTLNCTKNEEMTAGKATEKQIITFNNNKISLYEAEISVTLNDDYENYAELLLKSLEDPFKNFKDEKGIKYKASQKDNKIYVTFSGKYSEMSKDVQKQLGISDNYSLKEIKKELEDDGYICK